MLDLAASKAPTISHGKITNKNQKKPKQKTNNNQNNSETNKD